MTDELVGAVNSNAVHKYTKHTHFVQSETATFCSIHLRAKYRVVAPPHGNTWQTRAQQTFWEVGNRAKSCKHGKHHIMYILAGYPASLGRKGGREGGEGGGEG